jgi:hypothetical protein
MQLLKAAGTGFQISVYHERAGEKHKLILVNPMQ